MPIHDWTRVDAGLFHHFHQNWTVALGNALNAGVLPAGYFALIEQRIPGPIPDVLTLELSPRSGELSEGDGGVAVAAVPPRTQKVLRKAGETYPGKANRITIRHRHGNVVAVVEVVSPGNKATSVALRAFVKKSADLIYQGVHLLVIDLFPPGKRDPLGIHKALWDEFGDEEELELPGTKPLTLASYDAGPECVAYVNFVGVGDALPDMPLFLRPGIYVPTPLEATYQTTWNLFPAALKGLLDGPTTEAPSDL